MSLESLTLGKSGVLGRGATVVRTPQEALAGTSASYVDVASGSLQQETADAADSLSDGHESAEEDSEEYEDDAQFMHPRPESPPLPPLPDLDSSDSRVSQVSSLTAHAPVRPSRPPPAAPSEEMIGESSTPHSSPKSISPSHSIASIV